MKLIYENRKIKEGYTHIIGCDEVGRGCLAGPVAAAAVLLPVESEKLKVIKSCGIRDSKLLSADKRQELSAVIREHALWGIGLVAEKVIDEINIHNATLLAMRLAVQNLLLKASYSGNNYFLYIDGKFILPEFHIEQQAVVDGDNKILSVAAASIVAKVYRDELMRDYDMEYPEYNFAQHKGYATFHHRQMITEHGLSAIHRLSFCGQFK